tara:strand:+ start:82 stop:507 length:426 start_codon:yes stop_codon:yes gene_type:complete
MNDNEPKSKLSAKASLPSLKNIIGIYPCILLIVFGVLYYLERSSNNIVKPKWYQDLKLSIPGVAEYDQRKRMEGMIRSLELSGIVSTTSSNAEPPEYGSQDVGKDIWGTPFRCEMTNNLLSIRSAGPDKKHYTLDDRVYRN